MRCDANLSCFFNAFEDVHVHVRQDDERDDGGGDGGVPDDGHCVPEHVYRVLSRLARPD